MSTKLGHILEPIVNSKKCLACKGCCIFDNPNEEKIAPVFTTREIQRIETAKRKLIEKRIDGVFQAKLIRCVLSEFKKCAFLEEGSHACQIYDNRPLDCELWPFVLGYDRKDKSISLWVVSSEMCPAVETTDITPDLVDQLISLLGERGVIEEITKDKRYVWGYEPYHIFLRKLISDQ